MSGAMGSTEAPETEARRVMFPSGVSSIEDRETPMEAPEFVENEGEVVKSKAVTSALPGKGRAVPEL